MKETYTILLAMNGITENQIKEIVTALEKYGISIEKIEAKYSKLGVHQYLSEHKVDVAILAEYVESANPYLVSDYEMLADEFETVLLIPLLQDKHKSTSYVKQLFSAGIFNALFSSDANPEYIAKLIKNVRTRKEGKIYYAIKNIEGNTDFANIHSCIEFIEKAMTPEEILYSVDFIHKKVMENEFQTILKHLNERVREELKKTEEYALFFLDAEPMKRKGIVFPNIVMNLSSHFKVKKETEQKDVTVNDIFPKDKGKWNIQQICALFSFQKKEENNKKAFQDTEVNYRIQRGIIGTIFVTQLKHGSGCTHFASTCANVFLHGTNKIAIVHSESERKDCILKEIEVISIKERFDTLYPKYDYIIYDGGVYNEMTQELHAECNRAYAKIMLCKADEDYLKKLAAFVEKQGDTAQTWIYVFNMIPEHIVPKIKSLMMCYEILFLPIYSTTEIPKKIKKIIEKW